MWSCIGVRHDDRRSTVIPHNLKRRVQSSLPAILAFAERGEGGGRTFYFLPTHVAMLGGGSLMFSVVVAGLAAAVPYVWHFLHANLSNRFTSMLLLVALMARCHGVGRKGKGRGGFSAFQLGYALGLCGLLVLLVAKWPELSVKRASSQGDVASILSAMDTYAWHEGHTQHACAALALLASHDFEGKDKVASAGGITRLLNAMAHHRGSAGIQAAACSALAVIATEDYTNKARIIEGKGIVRVVEAMKDHDEDAGVQQHACSLLTNLAIGDDDNRAAIVKADGLTSIMQAMRLHRLHGGVQAEVCAALRSLAANDGLKIQIADAGAIPLIAEALDLHIDFGPLVEQACWALRNLAGIDATRARIADAGGIERIVSIVMVTHRTNPSILEQAAGALRNLALNSDDNKHRIAAAGCYHSIECGQVLVGCGLEGWII